MRAMRISNPQMRAIADQMEQDEVVRWASSLARARVTRWGGMISTPDAMLQVCNTGHSICVYFLFFGKVWVLKASQN